MPSWTNLRAKLAPYAANLRRNTRLHRYDLTILGFIASAFVVFLLPFIIYTVPAGETGVIWRRFAGGTVTDHFVDEGTHFIFPWDRLFIYDLKLQTGQRHFNVRAADGLELKVDVVWRYRLVSHSVGELHKFVGKDYADKLIEPTVGARTRDIVGRYATDDILTRERLTIQEKLAGAVRAALLAGFNPENTDEDDLLWCVLEDILIRGITLPQEVQGAIMRKEVARQHAQEYEFIIDKEKKESERKQIEAIGIRNFQEIVSNGMSDSYLRWRGIEATLELSRSPNAKVVVIGNAKNGLPLILNPDAPIRPEDMDRPGAPPETPPPPPNGPPPSGVRELLNRIPGVGK